MYETLTGEFTIFFRASTHSWRQERRHDANSRFSRKFLERIWKIRISNR